MGRFKPQTAIEILSQRIVAVDRMLDNAHKRKEETEFYIRELIGQKNALNYAIRILSKVKGEKD